MTTAVAVKTVEQKADAKSIKHTILMCAPQFFDVNYVINPWMEGNIARTQQSAAQKQWAALREIVAKDAEVTEIAPVAGLPDLVFTANAGLVYGKRVILSRFRHPERQGEEPNNSAWFSMHGFDVIEPPRDLYFEGAGDALFDRGVERLWLGHGWRTVFRAAEYLSQQLNVEVIPLRLVDDRFYHLDTCFCPLTGGYVIYYPLAFDEKSRRVIEELIPSEKRFAVSDIDALHFACNAIDTERTVILNDCTPELEAKLREWGFDVARTPLTQFLLAGGAAKCLSLRLTEDEYPSHRGASATEFSRRIVALEGHLLDTGVLGRAMDLIAENRGSFSVLEFKVGQHREDKSYAKLSITASTQKELEDLLRQLLDLGAVMEDSVEAPAILREAEMDGVAPDDFYCTAIYPTKVQVEGQWIDVQNQRMDGVIIVERDPSGKIFARVSLIRNIRKGDHIVCGVDGIRIEAPKSTGDDGEFKFMSSAASSERRVEVAVDAIAWEMKQIRARKGRIVVVSGPVAIHTGGAEYLCELIRNGYIQALLSGNALAVHDMERDLYGTSLGVDLKRGVTVHGGHRHHLSVINTVRRAGSIAKAVEKGIIKNGIMYELVKNGVPFSLAGSIRDDGPLPDTIMDLEKAQEDYQRLLKGADMILMLSTMLHSIGVGNMTPAGVRLVCVDINTAVATKLADRGSIEATPVVTDVGLFLNLLVRKLADLEPRRNGSRL